MKGLKIFLKVPYMLWFYDSRIRRKISDHLHWAWPLELKFIHITYLLIFLLLGNKMLKEVVEK